MEKDGFGFAAAWTELVGSWERRIRSHILSHTSSITNLAMEVVLVDTVGRGRLAHMAGAAGEHQLVIDAVLLGVEKVGAFSAELEVNLI